MIRIVKTDKSDPLLWSLMYKHYSQPNGFVGRQMFYRIYNNDNFHGCIAFGSAVLRLPNRQIIKSLNHGMNNIFYSVHKISDKYPSRNFTTSVLIEAESVAIVDWYNKYGDQVYWIESLVELPRSGDLYLKAGYNEVAITKGFTCKRTMAGRKGSDNWSGGRVWDKENLRPKRVFVKVLQ